jgi:hypothetical protein
MKNFGKYIETLFLKFQKIMMRLRKRAALIPVIHIIHGMTKILDIS